MKLSMISAAIIAACAASSANAGHSVDVHSRQAEIGKKVYHGFANFERHTKGMSHDDIDADLAHA